MYALMHIDETTGYDAAILIAEDDTDTLPPTRPELEQASVFGRWFVGFVLGGGALVLPLPAHTGAGS